MLSVLRIVNLAIIRELEIEFSEGLNVLTGEIGSGKSMILKAVDLLVGRRATADLIRHNCDKLEVEALFSNIPAPVLESLQQLLPGLPLSEEISIRRSVEASNRSKSYVNGKLAGVAELQTLGARLVSVTGQNQQQSLLESGNQRAMVDGFGVDRTVLSRMAECWQQYCKLKQLYREALTNSEAKAEYFRRLSFEADELRQAKLKAGEREELEQQIIRLGSFEKLSALAGSAIQLFEEDGGLESQLSRFSQALASSLEVDPSLRAAVEMFGEAKSLLEETAAEVRSYQQDLRSCRQFL